MPPVLSSLTREEKDAAGGRKFNEEAKNAGFLPMPQQATMPVTAQKDAGKNAINAVCHKTPVAKTDAKNGRSRATDKKAAIENESA